MIAYAKIGRASPPTPLSNLAYLIVVLPYQVTFFPCKKGTKKSSHDQKVQVPNVTTERKPMITMITKIWSTTEPSIYLLNTGKIDYNKIIVSYDNVL